MLEDDYIRNLVIDGLYRESISVNEFIHKLRYAMKDDLNEAYTKGYFEGVKASGKPEHYNDNL
jgi:hypothetical protein